MFLGRHLDTQREVALKVFDKSKITEQYVLDALDREAMILRKLLHPNIITMYKVINRGKMFCLALELADEDLMELIERQGLLSEPVSRLIVRQIVLAVEYMHSKGVVHRDLKPNNVMMSRDGVVKVIDFGLSNVLVGDTLLETQCGSMCYSAPELLCNKPYGKEVDIWSIGICLYVMLTGTLPFESDSLTELHAMMLDGQYVLPESATPELNRLLCSLFQCRLRKRIDIPGLWADEWMKQGEDGADDASARETVSPRPASPPAERANAYQRRSSMSKPFGNGGEGGSGGGAGDRAASAAQTLVRPRMRPPRLDSDEGNGAGRLAEGRSPRGLRRAQSAAGGLRITNRRSSAEGPAERRAGTSRGMRRVLSDSGASAQPSALWVVPARAPLLCCLYAPAPAALASAFTCAAPASPNPQTRTACARSLSCPLVLPACLDIPACLKRLPA